jgi:hypothetical protein
MVTTKKKMVRTSVIVPEERYNQLLKLADSGDVSVAWLIRYALTEFLNQHHDVRNLKLKPTKK